ncbi:hypothetical protein JYU34_012818 [Plutella xylostella]|uniref:Uncharacterized protein n=1 Tax=Plutella xylostella TaxID=51655 RepID=A0ABQ7QD71_PLUXY|nr:hypothetical protein JYU34_012818 [Plutella xylostella]
MSAFTPRAPWRCGSIARAARLRARPRPALLRAACPAFVRELTEGQQPQAAQFGRGKLESSGKMAALDMTVSAQLARGGGAVARAGGWREGECWREAEGARLARTSLRCAIDAPRTAHAFQPQIASHFTLAGQI